MSIFSKIKARVKSARLKTKAIAAGFIVATAGVAAVATLGNAGASPVSTPNCDNNAVVYCGASNVSQLQSKYNNGDGRNSAASIHNIYNCVGITSTDIANMGAYEVSGYVTKSGDVYAGGTLVATNALTGGRQNPYGSKSTYHNCNGTTYYSRTPSVSFLNDELSAMVVVKNGIFQYAILVSCGNAVTATPKMPAYNILKQVRAGTSGNYSNNVTVPSGSKVEYQITINSTGQLPVDNVHVHDTLPSGITYTSGTLQENGNAVSAADTSAFFGSGLNIPTIINGHSAVFTFDATAGAMSSTDSSCKATTIDNTGYITSVGLPNGQSSAGVTTTCTPPPALSCTSLTAIGGNPDAATGNQNYTFTAKSSVSNATITGYTFDFGDGKTAPVTSGSTTATAAHTYAPGTYTATVTVNATANGKNLTASGPACQYKITVKPPVPSALVCEGLTLTAGTADAQGNTPYTLKATASETNAHISTYTFDFGDDNTQPVNATSTSASTTHTYAPGTYTANVTVSGTDAAGKAITAPANPKCAGSITVKTPECKPGVPMGSPACSPSSLTCVGLSDVPGDVTATTGAQAFTFTGQATAANATIGTYTFNFGDGTTVPIATSATTANATHTYAPGTYTATLMVAGKDASGNPIQAPANPKCSVQITVKTPECKPGVQAGSSSCFTYTCNAFTLTVNNDTRTATVASFNATSTNPAAVLSHISIDWGDGATTLTTDGNPVGQAHAFTVDSSTVTATAQFTTPDQTTPVSSTVCSQPVSFTTPTPPPVLPNTGAGDTIGIFVGAVAAGTIAARLFLGRKLSRS